MAMRWIFSMENGEHLTAPEEIMVGSLIGPCEEYPSQQLAVNVEASAWELFHRQVKSVKTSRDGRAVPAGQ